MDFFFRSVDATQIADTAPTIFFGVAIEDFAPKSSNRNADLIALSRYRCEIKNDQDGVLIGLSLAEKRNDARRSVIAVHPFETCWIKIEPVQGCLRSIGTIQLRHPIFKTTV